MFVVDWLWEVLNWFGIGAKSARILFLGLDNAGKTTLLHVLKDDRVAQHVPTLHPHSEEFAIGKTRFKTFDLGGHETARRIWKDYFAAVSGVVFMVDASDVGRLAEARSELNGLLESGQLENVPFIIFGNKIDKPEACSEEDFRIQLGLLTHLTYGKEKKADSNVRPVEVFMCSVVKRSGYQEGFQWLSKFL